MERLLFTATMALGLLQGHLFISQAIPPINQGSSGSPDDVAVLTKKAEAGDATAQLKLGLLYWLGEGVQKDKSEAVKWYRKAAKQNDAGAMFNLAVAYFNGEGAPSDPIEAYAWFLLAQANGSKQAADAVHRSEADLQKLSQIDAWLQVADMLRTGKEVTQNTGQAAYWYQRAAETGNAAAAVRLAEMLALGNPPDYANAQKWCQYAAERRFAPAMYCLGRIFQNGLGVPRQSDTAAKWFRHGAEAGDGPSARELAQIYWKGDGVKADHIAAYMWSLIAFSAQATDARSVVESFHSQMSDKEIEKARRNAADYVRDHRMGVRLREPTSVAKSSGGNQ